MASIVQGPLSKWTNVVSGWQYRWFVLDQSTGLLSYYTSKEKMTKGSRRGCIVLKKAVVGIDDEDNCTFTIHVDGRAFHFQGQDGEERERWVNALESTIRRFKQPLQKLELTLPQSKRGLTVDNRLLICESYYSLLTQQIETLSESMNDSEEAKLIQKTAHNMLVAMKQCIDLMKDDQVSEKESLSSLMTNSDVIEKDQSIIESLPPENGSKESYTEEVPNISEDDVISEDGSSSDDEFYDAEDTPTVIEVVTSPSVSIPTVGDASDIEEDDEYFEKDDTSSSVAANRSIIMYMISQVKVGMDLTRVTLPTFILEKRSLLEMYADFLAHPDLFASINDYSTPKERMIECVRYYVCSFHASRKGTVAKKPYNPILGEIFRCYFDLPTEYQHPLDQETCDLVKNGPVPFASNHSVTFIAEQVSHHPPISAFYAECPSKRMYATGSVYTKSKFLGLSLGVHNIGKLTLNLMDHDEVYECTIPNAYARSILTYPWMELGGKCYLKCEKTGYHANVEFHCKPFYGGKKHKVTAEIFEGSDKKPFMKLEGEWNAAINVKHPNGDEETFVNTLNMPTIRKKFKKIDQQELNESKRQWKKLTEALRNEDINTANDAKHELEEKQRADARERDEKGIEWKQKHFYSDGELWWYNNPLSKRIADRVNTD